MRGDVILGVDGGGTSTTARVQRDGELLFERVGGPTDLTCTPAAVLVDRLGHLLHGCPRPTRAGVCLAGLVARHRQMLQAFFGDRFPGAVMRFEPDYAAAFQALPSGTLVGVIVGAGSVVCSRDEAGCLVASDGDTLDDHGPVVRIGQALTSRCLEEPDAVAGLAGSLCRVLDVGELDEVVEAVYGSALVPRLLAAAMSLLTYAADGGSEWAREIVDEALAPLATTTARHLRRHHRELHKAKVGLVGGVWQSPTAIASFAEQVRRAADRIKVETVLADRPPVQGALRLAMEDDRDRAS
jgi:N-acetylglucosamine kinase-like BadF-type ATPase